MLEGREFVVGVYVLGYGNISIPVSGATVLWVNGTYVTDSTGRVTLTAPLVNADIYFQIRATKKGYQDAVGRILILNQLPQLVLVVPSQVHENEDFVAYVHDTSGIPVGGVRVGFRSGDLYFGGGTTGPNGTVIITAPQVNEDTVYEMGAMKSGYLSGVAYITVLDADPPQLMLAIPSSMPEGREFIIGVYILGNENITVPIAYATVYWLNGSYLTNANGTVELQAPLVSYDTYMGIYAHKDGYCDASGLILILDEGNEHLQLEIPQSVLEGINFTIAVYSLRGPITNAIVTWINHTYYTDSNGTVEITAPCVTGDTSFEIRADKEGYLSAIGSILVRDENISQLMLYLPSSVIEGSIFMVGVYAENTPIAGATVYWGYDSFMTSDNGTVYLQAPYVLYDTWNGIHAEKQGYREAEGTILVLNSDLPAPIYVEVDDDCNHNTPGWGYDHFTSIQTAIYTVASGGTVFVHSGTYYEPIIISKPLILDGQCKDTVFIDGNHQGTIIRITASDVLIDDMTLSNAGSFSSGIMIDHANNVSVYGMKILGCTFGIDLEFSNFDTIELNTMVGCTQMGLLLEYSSNNEISRNTISDSGYTGIHLVHDAPDNAIFHNNIINSRILQAFSSDPNIWDNGYHSGGNYWSDYTGVDANGDGIGDTPYIIPGQGNNQDNYPLMQPWG